LGEEAAALIRRAAPYPPIPRKLGMAELKLIVPIVYGLKR